MRKSKIECPTCDKASGLALGTGFSRRNFLRLAGTGIVASWFADVVSPRLLHAATAPGVSLHNTAKNCILIFLAGAPSNIDMFDLKEGSWTPSDFAPTSFNGGNVRFAQGLLPKTAAHLSDLALVRPVLDVGMRRWRDVGLGLCGLLRPRPGHEMERREQHNARSRSVETLHDDISRG